MSHCGRVFNSSHCGKTRGNAKKKGGSRLIAYQLAAMTNDFALYNFLDFFPSKHTLPVWDANSVPLIYSVTAGAAYVHVNRKPPSTPTATCLPPLPPGIWEHLGPGAVILIAKGSWSEWDTLRSRLPQLWHSAWYCDGNGLAKPAGIMPRAGPAPCPESGSKVTLDLTLPSSAMLSR